MSVRTRNKGKAQKTARRILMEDTISAISTAYGEGGIGIVRISGEQTEDIIEKIFGKVPEPRVMTYGHITDNFTGELIDEVMVCLFKAPKSYTAEDVAEIQCHGSVVSLRKILDLVIRNGARLAEPGEFTRRAFLNGRLDLSQAEAVIDLIKARTDRTFETALDQLQGGLSQKIRSIRAKLVDVLVDLTVNIDYPDEDIEEITYDKLESSLEDIRDDILRLVKTIDTGRILREGLRVSIIGKPNVGKSSLMNALLNENRAIVTEIPGTTRDTIEETLSIGDIPVVLTDTAGIRDTEDLIEKIGIEKSKEAFNRADLVIFILDQGKELEEEDLEITEVIGDRRAICLLNKSDLPKHLDTEVIRAKLPNASFIETSITEGRGLDELVGSITSLVYSGEVKQEESTVITNVRHAELLRQAEQSVDDALNMVRSREALEVLEIDVNSAYDSLGLIIGEEVGDDIIDEVFARFCLGK